MHLGLMLALAGQVASPEPVDARGNQDVVFRAPATGMYRVRVQSEAGTACSLADHLRGPFASSGIAGERSCDVDAMLDAGLYKARLSSPPKGKGKAKLDAIPFAEAMRPFRLDEGRALDLTLKPHTQLTTWLRVTKRESVTVEVAGRTAGRVSVWRDGRWLEEVPMRHTEVTPRQGKAIHRWRMDAVLEPGDYALVVYGTDAKAWTQGPEEDVLFITRGAPAGSAARSQAFTLPSWGFTQITVPFGDVAAFLQLDASGSEPVSLTAEGIRVDRALGPVRATSGSSCTIAAGAPLPSCSITSRAGSEHVLTVTGPPGARGELTWGALATWQAEGYWQGGSPELQIGVAGTYFVTAPPLPLSMDAEPLGCAIDEVTDRGHFVRRVAVDAPAVSWTQPFERAFNYGATSTSVWVAIEKPGLYEITGDDKTKASCEVFAIDGWNKKRVGEGEDGKCRTRKALGTGVHEIRFYGGRAGIQTLRVAQVGLGSLSADTPAKSSCTFPSVALTPGRYRLATSSPGGAQLRAFMARASPASFAVATPVVVDPGRPITISLTAGDAVIARTRPGQRVSCALDGAPLAARAGVCQSGALAAAAALTLTNAGPAPAMVLVGRVQPPAVASAPPPFDPAVLRLPTIVASAPQWLDFERSQQRSFLVNVERAGLYDLGTDGLLATSCRLRTPTIGKLAEGSGNGRGKNCLVQAYLKPGTYLFTAQAMGQSRGRAAVRLAQRPPRDLGAVPLGEDVFFRVPAGELAQQTLDVKTGGTFLIGASAQAAALTCRIDDHDGWPLLPVPAACAQSLELDAGRYLITALPLTVDSRRRTSFARPVEELVLEGDATHRLALNRRYEARLGADGKDAFTFTLAAETTVGIELDHGMQGRLLRTVKGAKGAATREVIDTVPPAGGGGFALGASHDEGVHGGDEGASDEGGSDEGSYEGGSYEEGAYEGGEEYGEYDESGDGEGYAERMRREAEERARALAAEQMARATAPREVGALAGKIVRLPPGTYVLEAEHSRGDVGIRYGVKIGVRALAPGVVLSVPVPGRVDVTMPATTAAHAGLLRIKTRGDADVRCRLFTKDGAGGALVAESADSGADWNCALAVPLAAGTYSLVLEAETLQPGITELSAAFLEAKDTGELADGDRLTVAAKVATAPLPAAGPDVVHDVSLTSTQDFSCAVQDDKGALLAREVSVKRCRFLLWPGPEKRGFRVFTWTPDRRADVKVSLARRAVRGFSGGGLSEDVVGRAAIGVRGRFATGEGASCRQVSEGGGVLTSCAGAASFVPGDVLVAVPASGKVALEERVAELGARAEERRVLTGARAAERQRTRGGKKSVHLVEVHAPFGSASSPSCALDGGVATRDAATCAAATGPVAESTLAAWTRPGTLLDATIARRAVAWPEEAKPLEAGRSSLSWADESARYALPGDAFRLQLSLPAGGWAVLLDARADGSFVARDVCAPRRNPTPERPGALASCVLRGRGGELFVASPAGVVERQARADLLLLETVDAPRALVGAREVKPLAPGRERLLVAPAPAPRVLRVEGWGVLACAVHKDDGTHVAGCTATLPAGQGAEIKVEHDERPWRAFTWSPSATSPHAAAAQAGARAVSFPAGRYGALPPAAPREGVALGKAVALRGDVVDRAITLGAPSAVRVRATSGVCALSSRTAASGAGEAKGAWTIVDAVGLGGGCDVVRVLPAGTHRVTVRGFGTAPLAGTVSVSAEPVHALAEGVNAEAIVGAGDARTYRFALAGDGEIGIGVQVDGDTLSCALFTERQELVGDGCHQFHRALAKGTYYLRVAAPDDAPPRRFKPVIFGLRGSAIDVPEEWLRDFFARAGVVDAAGARDNRRTP